MADQTNSDMLQNSSDLYNGNIARMVTTITDPNSRAVLPLGNAYQYDQLNRLKHAVSFDQMNGNAWAGGAPAKYENSFTYDANGNILTQTRNDDNNQVIDELAYFYPQNAANKTVRNRLLYVSDNVDYDASDINPGMATNNYAYDQEGRLIQDLQEQIASIEWRVDGKVKRINRIANSTKQNLSFDYDAMGHRIAKHVYTSANVLEKSTYYVLDAQGNTMATYERAVDENTLQISYAQTEKFIYGSARLGVQNVNIGLLGSQNNTYTQTTVVHRIGKKGYELSNHLGNVLSVISDKVIPHSNGTIVDYWLADILQSSDYSPFGVTLKGRNLEKTGLSDKFRFGFQNQEMDNELKGKGNSVNFEYRMHDPRLGRFFAIDPLAPKYPYYSPYAFSGNRVIDMIELEGLEPSKTPKTGECESCKTITIGDGDVVSDVQKQTYMIVFNNVTQEDFNAFTKGFLYNPGTVTNNDWAEYKLVDRDGSNGLSKNDHIDIDIWGPDNGSVLVKDVQKSDNYAMANFQTLEGHPDAGEIFFIASYDAVNKQMSFTITNTTQTNVDGSAVGGSSYARYAQQSQWEEVLGNIYDIMKDKGAYLKEAKETITEYDYDEDSPNKMGEIESTETNNLWNTVRE